MAYQGWKNYATGGVALVIDNDEMVLQEVAAQLDELREAAPDREETYWSEKEYIKFNLADWIKEVVEEVAELDTNRVGRSQFSNLMTSQLLMAALGEVDWNEIAEHYMKG